MKVLLLWSCGRQVAAEMQHIETKVSATQVHPLCENGKATSQFEEEMWEKVPIYPARLDEKDNQGDESASDTTKFDVCRYKTIPFQLSNTTNFINLSAHITLELSVNETID